MELYGDEMRQREPDLHPRYQFGVLVEEAGRCRDPGGYVAALAEHALRARRQFVRARANGLDLANGKLMSVLTDTGEIACDAAVIAAGARFETARRLDRRPPAAGDRAWLSRHDRPSDTGPRTSMMASDARWW